MSQPLKFRAMGCQMLAAVDLPHDQAQQALAQVPGWFAAWEASLSRFQPGSELNQLNDRPGVPVRVSETLWSVLQAARRAEAQSAGLVTPVLLDALIAAGYGTSFDRLPSDQAASPASLPERRRFSLRDIMFRAEDRSVCLPEGLRLDLGGVAKGWAAQRAMRRLEGYGPALVDAGGDIAVSGPGSGERPWLVGIDDPRGEGESLGTLRLGRCGVATSGRDYRRWKQDGRWKHHIIDPRSGEPAVTDVLTATVIAPTVMEAETAAKVMLILGSWQGLAWLESRPGYTGLVVTESGDVVTRGMLENLAMR
jgi:thiamine biosynthesis lipoprotein